MEPRSCRRFLKSIVLLFIFAFNSCSNTKEEVIIPSNFKGYVVIFYQQNFIKGTSEKKGNKLTIHVPHDGVVFTEFINTGGDFFVHFIDNNQDKLITGHHVGSIYLDKEIPYTVFYVGDTLDLQKMKKLQYDDLKFIYDSNLNR